MKKYTLAVTSPEYWSEIHDALIVDSNQDGIPDRQVTCSDSKEHSPTRGTYELTDAEAVEIANHSHIKWIELSPTDNPDNYPKPQPATKRFRSNVKIYRDLNGGNQPPTSSPTTAEIDRTNWAVKRVGIHSNGDFWPVTSYTGNIAALNGDTSYSLTGKNVDLVIHDSGVMQYHPEFIDGNGKSRVRDIVLDGPYYIDPDYFNSNNYTYVKMDGRIGITTTSAHNWWENSSLRSAAFSSAGTVWISSNYTVNRSMGDVGTTNALTSGHGTGAAGVSAGNNFGLAFEANIWNMPGISDNVSMGIEANYDLMKIFHKYKPINAETGVKNPTLVNGSWGHQAGFASNDTVSYKFRGSTGTFTGNDSVTNQVTAWKDGFNNQIVGAYKSWSSSSRSNSTDTAGNEMIAEGVIYVAAAGNNNQRMGIGRSDPDRLNYMEDEHYNVGDPRSEFPGLACPSNHRDWMNPQGIGFDEANDYHPVICVGCVDEYVDPSTKQERKADYSNNGPGIDIWGFGDEALSAGLSGDSSYEDFPRYSSSGPTYYDCLYNGTSSAAPTIAGLIALYLETNPKADSRDVKYWLNNHASRIVDDGEYQDVQSDDTTTAYWTGGYNMRGAEKRLPIDPYASDVIPSIKIIGSGVLNTLKITSKLTNITTPSKGASITPTTWSAGTEAQDNTWQGVTYGNGRFVAVSNDGTNRVMSSTDGINWTSHSAASQISWQDVHYSTVHQRFVAVSSGNSNTNRIMYSSNGTSWTSASLQDENSFTCYNNSIASGSGANGKFVIVGAGGVDRIRWSNDGTVWNTGSASENSGWRSVAYGNGYFVAVAVTGTNRVMRSTSGTSWTSITNTGSGNDFVGHYSTAYGNGTFVTVSASATNKVKYSTNNGSTWTGVNMGSMTVGSVITFIEDTSGTGYFMIRSTNLLYSTDGINWTEVTMSSGPQSRAVTNGDDLAVSVGGGGAFYYNMRENTYDSPSTLKLFYK